ncbi:unnamed protein product [Dovyalis caffra]|uniref:Aluminum-activated malate transporter 2-like n=1 Tax=Dovyalis caffra TaxID=77055 RepID=A0AAV1RF46_9ROSI|nr:unnamed protein product [Dovyalis caffra]
METSSGTQNNGGYFSRGCRWIKALPERSKAKIVEFARKIKKVGQDDPRRINHSLKVGLAITLVSLFYYFEPLYNGFGDSAMWAVLTVVVVFEFSVGATLGRGLNRGLATFLAGTLGFGAHHLAILSGEKGEPILLGLFVFVLATTVTFVRFFPRMKARYDYGLLIFILTFCLISVSGYRDDKVLDMAHRRVSTILIGGLTAVFVCICICPVWAGDDLHNLAATNIEKLGIFLERFGVEFFHKSGEGESINKASLQGYKSVLNSKNIEESLVNFARWEPGHGRFKFRHPWKHYIKIGSLTRQCAYRVEALNGYLNSDIKTPPEIRGIIKDSCKKMSSESGKALKEIALAIKSLTPPSSASPHIVKSKNAAKNLKFLLNTDLCKDIDLLEVVPAATVTSLLIDVISCTEKIADSIHELASLAQFKNVEQEKQKLPKEGEMQQGANKDTHHHVITIELPSPVKLQNGNLSSSTTTAMVIFLRLFPHMKARYDYGFMVFMSTLAGDDLHKLVAANIKKLGMFLRGFGVEFFRISVEGESKKASLQGYKSILNSKNTEEYRWNPHPRYQKIASLLSLQAIEMASPIHENAIGTCPKRCQWLKAMPFKLSTKVVELVRKIRKLARDDPRRIIHSFKVGLARTLLSLFYYFDHFMIVLVSMQFE